MPVNPRSRLVLGSAAWLARRLPSRIRQKLYHYPWLARWIRSRLNRAAPSGLNTVMIAAGELAGMQMSLDLQAEKDYWLGTYEPELLEALKRLVQPGTIVYDIGANIGYLSLVLGRLVGNAGQVYAFEALPQNLERLAENLALNDFQSRVTIVGGAVVESNRPVQFLPGPSHGTGKALGSSGRQELDYSQNIEVPGISIDNFVYSQGQPAPQLIKMDIEGGEVLAFPGMVRLLQLARPILLIELHGPEAARIAWDHLRAARYRLCSLHDNFPEIRALDHLDWKSYIAAFPMI